jgi:uncharacterized protein YndB with AHSA1/START domain
MSTAPFTLEHTYQAPVKKVWEDITDKAKMKQWYFDLSEFRPEVGFEFSFTGQGSKGEKYIHLCKILEVVENKKISYSWTYKDYQGYSVVTFELFEEGEDKTRLKLTHAGLETFPGTGDFARTSFEAGWNQLIGTSLTNFVEKE